METRAILQETMDKDQGSQPRVLPCIQSRLNKAVASVRLHPSQTQTCAGVADATVVSRHCLTNRPWATPLCSKMTESVSALISPWGKGSILNSGLVTFVQGEGKYKKSQTEKILRMRKKYIPHRFNLSFKLPNASKESCKHQLMNLFFCFDC